MIVVRSGVVAGIEGFLIEVEVDVRPGLPGFEIVGLPSKTVKESRERVRSALRNSGFKFPAQKVIVNLAPAHYPKDGSLFDLPIALGILAHQGVLPSAIFKDTLYAGELSLSGTLKPINGVLSLADLAQEQDLRFVLPEANREETAFLKHRDFMLVPSLKALLHHVQGKAMLPCPSPVELPKPQRVPLVEIKGQSQAKRALEIGALGRHHIMLLGPPGVGKTLLARSAQALLPPLEHEELIVLNKIRQAPNVSQDQRLPLTERPVQAPHHSISQAALIGGKSGRPGEITLAHLGILLLDEFPEFNQGSLQGLREPLDHKMVQIARATQRFSYPADFWLIATANPCPCGYLGSSIRMCTCTAADVSRYRRKLRGPLLDRFDLFVYLNPLSEQELRQKTIPWPAMSKGTMASKQSQSEPSLEAGAEDFIYRAQDALGLSVRGFKNCLRVATTIAQLDSSPTVTKEHLAEALQYRFENHLDSLRY